MMASPDTPESLVISVNLEEQAGYHIDFLARVESIPELKQDAVLRRALYRYEKFWLPLAASHSQECLSAPLDIEWVWHCHLLAPRTYAKDCTAIAGTIVPHTLRSREDYQKALEKSRAYWHQRYDQEDGANFIVDYNAQLSSSVPDDFKSCITYPVLEAAGRQKVFYYQVALPHYRDRKFLTGSLKRYRQFLYLKTKFPKSFSVPCFEMDLMWHTHLLNPLLYRDDTVAMLGHVFNHDDTVNDRSEGSRLNNAQAETTEQWLELFNESFSLAGAMYRGQPPGGVLYQLSGDEVNKMSTKSTELKLNSLTLKVPNHYTDKLHGNIKINAHGCANNRYITKWFSTIQNKNNIENLEDQSKEEAELRFETSEETLSFNTRVMNRVRIDVDMPIRKLACFGKAKNSTSSKSFDILSLIEKKSDYSRKTFELTQALPDGTVLSAEVSFSEPVRGRTLLFLQAGSEEKAVIPADVKSFLGPVNVERLYSGVDNDCLVTKLSLKNHVGSQELSVKVVYSQALAYTAIQVLYRGRMVAVAHPIGCEQLPSPSQVDDDVITLDHQQGEKALLIKNHSGDWAILKGKFVDSKTVGDTNSDGGNRQADMLSLYLYKMSTRSVDRTIVDVVKACCRLDDTRVDLSKGVIEIGTESMEIGERIALAFCVSLLHKTLMPNKPSA